MRRVLLVLGLIMLLQLALVPASSAASPPSGEGVWHRVRHGETLHSIGRTYHVSPYTICHVNGLKNCDHIYAGQKLWIPGGLGSKPPHPSKCTCATYHTVKYGQTLCSIARHHGVSLHAISRCNGIQNPNRIYSGQHLCIPAW